MWRGCRWCHNISRLWSWFCRDFCEQFFTVASRTGLICQECSVQSQRGGRSTLLSWQLSSSLSRGPHHQTGFFAELVLSLMNAAPADQSAATYLKDGSSGCWQSRWKCKVHVIFYPSFKFDTDVMGFARVISIITTSALNT